MKIIKIPTHIKNFLLHIGIDPQDFNDEFDIEMDDYSN
jgi:hypothetical protein